MSVDACVREEPWSPHPFWNFLRFIYVSLIKNYAVNVIKGPLDRNVTKSCVVPYTAPKHSKTVEILT